MLTATMLDFTSALYLGLDHPSRTLAAWPALTSGKPPTLYEPPAATQVATRLARLVGTSAAVLGPSTLHLFWDLFGLLATTATSFHLDAASYAIARWGLERFAAQGIPVSRFAHRDPQALSHSLRRAPEAGRRRGMPIVVCDGLCPSCGEPQALADYLTVIEPYGGRLVIDDTQALGILGHSAADSPPYGRGGGGSLRHAGIARQRVLWVASLAKGFGVPIACLGGPQRLIRRFAQQAPTRFHCSPPSAVAIAAAAHALTLNDQEGDTLRRRLGENVERFRRRLAEVGVDLGGGRWPFQVVTLPSPDAAAAAHRQLREDGIDCLRLEDLADHGRLGFVLSARHRRDDIDRASDAVAAICRHLTLSVEPVIACALS